ncbi:deoxycytidylate deaminase [Erysipelothrix piscisicarius]|uniref:deoxycytidylate deaminase n=1 Tax=Erysipelothrix piscisicarius TaxID=2485784 RepID=UPI0039E0EE99
MSALRSKDPSTQVGAAIVDQQKKSLELAIMAFQRDWSDDAFPWEREGDFQTTKYAYVVHAELNAILNATQSLQGCTIYVSLFPCNECSKAIIQSGIKEIVYEDDKYAETDAVLVSKRMLDAAGVSYRKIDKPIAVSLTHR